MTLGTYALFTASNAMSSRQCTGRELLHNYPLTSAYGGHLWGQLIKRVCDKHPMEFNQIAKKLDDGSWPKLILVEGAPGVGKSTFAWKLCRKWSKGKILSQYKLVVLLMVCLIAISINTSIYGAVLPIAIAC